MSPARELKRASRKSYGGGVEEGGDPAEATPRRAVLGDAFDAPLVADDRRRDAERDHVGEAVEFLAEGRLGAHQARDPAVEAVEDHGHEDRDGRALEIPVNGRDDRVEAPEQAACRQQVRQQEDPAAHACFVEIDFHASGVARPGSSA